MPAPRTRAMPHPHPHPHLRTWYSSTSAMGRYSPAVRVGSGSDGVACGGNKKAGGNGPCANADETVLLVPGCTWLGARKQQRHRWSFALERLEAAPRVLVQPGNGTTT